MDIHLIDGTYELFRHYYAVPPATSARGQEVGAVVGVLGSVLRMLAGGATHVGVATDHVIESFRNDLWPGYKTGAGVDPLLLAQFEPLEEALAALGVALWPMVELEADDAMASAARLAVDDARVRRVYLCTPDKDMAQCVVGDRVVQLDRRSGTVRDAQGVVAKFGVEPDSIPDYLALTGDSADGFPGLPGWGPKSAGAVLGRYRHLEAIPAEWVSWETPVRGAARLAATLVERWEEAILFRRLATLKTDAHLFGSIEELRWAGPRPEFAALCADLGALDLAAGASELSAAAERDRSHPRGGAPRI